MIGFFQRLWQRFVTTLSTVEDGAAVAFVRIAAGFALLVLVVPFVFSDAGAQIVGFVFVDDSFGGYRDMPGTATMRMFGGTNPQTVSALLITSLLAGACMVVGIFGRVPVLVAAVATRVVFLQNPDVSGGGDALLGNVLFLLLLADCTHTLSFDCWWRTRRLVDDTPIPAWPRKLALVQLAIMYTATGLQKLVSTTWTPLDGFSALYQILQSPQWARFPWLIEAADGWLVVPMALGTMITIIWECCFWLVLVKRRWRWVFAFVGVGIHIGIIALMEVGIFSWLSMALYPTMFPLAAARFARWIGRRSGGPEPQADTATS